MPQTSHLNRARVLVVDDDDLCRRHLIRLLQYQGHEAVPASDAQTALDLLRQGKVDVLITDLCMPDMQGTELIRRARKIDSHVPCILVTGFGTAERAVEALAAGAFWYLPKPFEGGVRTVTHLVDRALEHRRILIHRTQNASRPERPEAPRMIGESDALALLMDRVGRVAPLDTTVLVLGESGTGKDLVAREIHARSSRANKPYIAVNCGAIPEDLLESELFGHLKGAFTHASEDRKGRFAAADGGTLFLDEVGDMSLRFQVKMLRVLQTGDFQPVGSSKTHHADVRIIGATNQNVQKAVKEGRFREDLYYRLAVIPIEVPALRERPEDIPSLVEHFTERFRKSSGIAESRLSDNAVGALANHSWPGNIRELENLIERLLVLNAGQEVRVEDLPGEMGLGKSLPQTRQPALGFRDAVERFESDLILRALDDADWNKSAAATALGVKRTTLLDMIRRKNLDPDQPVPVLPGDTARPPNV